MMTSRQTCYEAYGVQCNEGWKELYQPLMDLCKLYGVQVEQVKEKFGLLRFYVSGARADELDLLIQAAENMSAKVCEDCGLHGYNYDEATGKAVSVVTTSGGWMRSLCPACREKHEAQGV